MSGYRQILTVTNLIARGRSLLLTADGSTASYLTRGISGSLLVQVSGLVCSLASGILLARTLGANSFGIYSYALAWLEVLKIPVAYGLSGLISREIAIYSASNDWAHVRGIVLRSTQFVFGGSCIIIIIFFLSANLGYLKGINTSAKRETFIIALLLLPLMALSSVRSGTLVGLQRVVVNAIPENIVRPFGVAVFVGILWLWLGTPIDPRLAMWAQVAAVAVSFATGTAFAMRSLPSNFRRVTPAFETATWARAALPFLLHSGAWVIWAQLAIVILGWYRPIADVGIFRVVLVLGGLVVLPLQAVTGTISPLIARLYKHKDIDNLQTVISRTTLLVMGFSVAGLVGYMAIGKWLLFIMFGPAYVSGWLPLIVVSIGNVGYSLFFTVNTILDNTGNQAYPAYGYTVALLINVALSFLLIPPYGVTGAAIASLSSTILGQGWLVFVVRNRIGIRPTGIFSLRQILKGSI